MKMILECVSNQKDSDGKRMWLLYSKPEERKFAPQFGWDDEQVEKQVMLYEGYDLTIFDPFDEIT
jgi:hypothetical protein